jgi:heat shock protein HtpX
MNVAVLLMISTIFTVFGLEPYLTNQGLNLKSLLIYSTTIGFTGSFISIMMSRWMAKRIFRIKILTEPHSQEEIFLFHTIQSLSTRAGIKMPQVGIYPSKEINAFATGMSKNKSLVAISDGLISMFSKDELEGVLAHEISHVASGDMLTMSLMQGVLNTFVIFISRALAYVVENFLGKNSKGINYLVYWITSIIFQIIFGILAGFILSAFSRRREFSADAGGAFFVGKSKMISALKRLQANTQKIDTPRRQASFAAFKIVNKPARMKWRQTHPSLEARIERLQKSSI